MSAVLATANDAARRQYHWFRYIRAVDRCEVDCKSLR
jgi:hypothetical protein